MLPMVPVLSQTNARPTKDSKTYLLSVNQQFWWQWEAELPNGGIASCLEMPNSGDAFGSERSDAVVVFGSELPDSGGAYGNLRT